MRKIVLTALLLSICIPLVTAAHADARPTQVSEKGKKPKPTPTPKPGPRDDGEGDQ